MGLGFIILLVAIPALLYLVRQQQILRSRAAGANSRIEFRNASGPIRSTQTQQVNLRLYWDGGTPTVTSTPTVTTTPTTTPRLTVTPTVSPASTGITYRLTAVSSPSTCTTAGLDEKFQNTPALFRTGPVNSTTNVAIIGDGTPQNPGLTLLSFPIRGVAATNWICAQFIVNGEKRQPMILGLLYQ